MAVDLGIPTAFLPRHYRRVDPGVPAYCAGCGKDELWPCPLAQWHDRLKSTLPIRWEEYPK